MYEDPDFVLPPPLAGEAVARLAPTIRSRNAGFEYWGWKIPDNIYYISNVIHLLVNPVFLIICRDPEAIARSSARHDRLDWNEQRQRSLDAAVTHTRKVRAFRQRLVNGFHVFQPESIHADPGAFVDRLAELLHPLPAAGRTCWNSWTARAASTERVRIVAPNGSRCARGSGTRRVG